MAKSILADLSDFRVDVLEDGKAVRTITDMSMGRDGHRTPTFEGRLHPAAGSQ